MTAGDRTILIVSPAEAAAANTAIAEQTGNPADALTFTVGIYDTYDADGLGVGSPTAYVCSWDFEGTNINMTGVLDAVATPAPTVDEAVQWAPDVQVSVDDLVWFEGRAYTCVQAHTTQSNWDPVATPALWAPKRWVDAPDPWVQPTGSSDAYQIGDRVTFEGHVYESVIAANVWAPDVYPAGWTLIS